MHFVGLSRDDPWQLNIYDWSEYEAWNMWKISCKLRFDFRITPDCSGPMTRVSCSTELEVNWPESMDQKLGLCFPDLADGVTGARGLSGELWTFAHHGVLYSLESKYEIMFSDMLYADSQMVSGDYITDTRSGTYGTIVPWNTFTPLTHKTLSLHFRNGSHLGRQLMWGKVFLCSSLSYFLIQK